jgi:hypothetical protein
MLLPGRRSMLLAAVTFGAAAICVPAGCPIGGIHYRGDDPQPEPYLDGDTGLRAQARS